MKKLFIFLAIILVTFLGLWIVKDKKTSTPTGSQLKVVTSFYPLYFFTSEIGGNKVAVSNLTPAGIEPHEYEPTAADIVAVERSSLLIILGNGFESWEQKVRQNLVGKSTEITEVGVLSMTKTTTDEDGESVPDPHIWLSPILAKNMVNKIATSLAKADPDNENYFLANADRLIQELDLLDRDLRAGLSDCLRNDLITSHAAFSYFAKEYSLRQVPISGLSPEEEPSLAQIVKVAKFAKENNVKYIFFETLVSPELSRVVADEIGASTLVLDPIEGLSESDIKTSHDYFSKMRDNLSNIRLALECQ